MVGPLREAESGTSAVAQGQLLKRSEHVRDPDQRWQVGSYVISTGLEASPVPGFQRDPRPRYPVVPAGIGGSCTHRGLKLQSLPGRFRMPAVAHQPRT